MQGEECRRTAQPAHGLSGLGASKELQSAGLPLLKSEVSQPPPEYARYSIYSKGSSTKAQSHTCGPPDRAGNGVAGLLKQMMLDMRLLGQAWLEQGLPWGFRQEQQARSLKHCWHSCHTQHAPAWGTVRPVGGQRRISACVRASLQTDALIQAALARGVACLPPALACMHLASTKEL